MFHSLVTKFRPGAKVFSRSLGSRTMSAPRPIPETSVQRSASAPYRFTTSIGSTPLPSDFDILRPCASRAIPCSSTV